MLSLLYWLLDMYRRAITVILYFTAMLQVLKFNNPTAVLRHLLDTFSFLQTRTPYASHLFFCSCYICAFSCFLLGKPDYNHHDDMNSGVNLRKVVSGLCSLRECVRIVRKNRF